MVFSNKLNDLLASHPNTLVNPPRKMMIQASLDNRECFTSRSGALVSWSPRESTGRSPADTVIVRRPESEKNIDWDSPNNLPLSPEGMELLLEDALALLGGKKALYVADRVIGADSTYALPVRTISDRALTTVFADNMFRPVPADIERSIFAKRPFTLICLPYDKLDPARYQGVLRHDPKLGTTSTMVIAMDLDQNLGVVIGSQYLGSCKKLMFTVMNYLLPGEGILPLHCSANEGPDGDIALLLGLSGTGKTTLSADPRRRLLGDDEHGWCDHGVANFENGIYAKLINLDPKKEPDIYNAVEREAPVLEHGAIVENAMMYPTGVFDFNDDRYTPNSRASFLLSAIPNIKECSTGGHPRTILFLTADANGVLPPVARLGEHQAMLWFLMGYTSKLAGTETGITDPVSTFSRFFGQPFMPRNPDVYASQLGEKLRKHGSSVWLVNTGWSGGPHGVGKRMDIRLTREIVQAALSGALDGVELREDPIFHVSVPVSCPGVTNCTILDPRSTWPDPAAYDLRARKLADDFKRAFEKNYGKKDIDPAVRAVCPGF